MKTGKPNMHRESWVFSREIPISIDIEREFEHYQFWRVTKKTTQRGRISSYKFRHVPSGVSYLLRCPQTGEARRGFIMSPAMMRLLICWFLVPYVLIMIPEFAEMYGIPWDAPLKSLEGILPSVIFYGFGGLSILFGIIVFFVHYASNRRIFRVLTKLECGVLIPDLVFAFLLYPYIWVIVLMIAAALYSWRVITSLNKAHLTVIDLLAATLSGQPE